MNIIETDEITYEGITFSKGDIVMCYSKNKIFFKIENFMKRIIETQTEAEIYEASIGEEAPPEANLISYANANGNIFKKGSLTKSYVGWLDHAKEYLEKELKNLKEKTQNFENLLEQL